MTTKNVTISIDSSEDTNIIMNLTINTAPKIKVNVKEKKNRCVCGKFLKDGTDECVSCYMRTLNRMTGKNCKCML